MLESFIYDTSSWQDILVQVSMSNTDSTQAVDKGEKKDEGDGSPKL